jgi:phosphate transport system substrate-binding protein
MKLTTKIIAAGLAFAPAASFAAPALNGAGATFPAPLYQRWFGDYAAATGNRVNYQSVGSGAGIKQFVAGTVDFAATDEPIKAKDAAKVKRGYVQIPMTGGTIAVAYNNPKCKLRLTQKQVVGVFQGDITDWKALGCAGGAIKVVHRSDGSGTTFAFTSSLNAFGGWKAGAAKSVNWPVGIGAKGNEGVAGTLTTTPGSIGYLTYSYVKGSKLQAASVQNKAGNYIQPSYKSGFAALNGIQLDPVSLAGEDFNPAGVSAYPISTLTWVLAYKEGNGAKAEAVRDALNYMLSGKAQMVADDLGYVPLAGSILNRARIKVKQVLP